MKGHDDRVSDNISLANAFDHLGLDDIDPNISEGYRIIYDREVPIEIRLQDSVNGPQDVGTLESIRTKIMIQGDVQAPSVTKIELTSESDLFFNYTSLIDENIFNRMRDDQKLNLDFLGLANIVTRMFNNCQKEPNTYFAVLFLQKDGSGRLDFIQNMEYKFLELLTLDFVMVSEETLRQNITFRYNSVKAKCLFLQGKLKDVSDMVKIKNPSLLLAMQKGGPGAGGQHNTNRMNSSVYSTSSKFNR